MNNINNLLKILAAMAFLSGASSGWADNFSAGPIWNNDDAGKKCPTVCTNQKLEWNGHWVTTIPNKESVCNCVAPITPAEEAKQPIIPEPPPPPTTKAQEPAGDVDTCPTTCKKTMGDKYTGESVFHKTLQKKVCRCHLQSARGK